MSKPKKNQTVYHYTDREGAEGIAQSGIVEASTDIFTDALCGPGVYATRIVPSSSNTKIAKNNYDDSPMFYKSKVDQGKTDYVVKITAPTGTFRKEDVPGRDIYRYRGDLDLTRSDIKATITERKKPSK